MKKTDALTAIGLLAGVLLLGVSMATGDGGIKIFWSASSIAITIGGSLAAVCMTYPMDTFKKFGTLIGQAFKEEQNSTKEVITQFADLSKKARREGLLSLEDEINQLEDKFLKKGLQMVVDGIEPETIKEILDLEIQAMDERHSKGAGMFTTWGGYAPGFGMLGTLIGLIQMLQNLSDASTIASGMGTALITTFYGSLLANLFANPIGANLAKKNEQEIGMKEMMVEGILAIQSGVNPRIVEEKLITYLEPAERLKYLESNSENSEGVA
ncbi:MAG: motility protein A [Clostridium sp.]|uniref:motility protein A n=1 Tax=Clostridium sp. DSM 8431 TaxID=1761781 RepID=UPI0008DFB470|nr:motility protein A [Clostridium sp. DSM 8431]MCR4944392.1 motility protein A [Clostridium sp.]SFU30937.1 chemotaxis protein MotA [Clostridium sp. DSM 8431]